MQSGFCATRESPHVHFPPSPRFPIRSSSCGQLNAGGKKSPEQTLSRPYMHQNTQTLTNSICRPWVLIWREPAKVLSRSETRCEERGKNLHYDLCR